MCLGTGKGKESPPSSARVSVTGLREREHRVARKGCDRLARRHVRRTTHDARLADISRTLSRCLYYG